MLFEPSVVHMTQVDPTYKDMQSYRDIYMCAHMVLNISFHLQTNRVQTGVHVGRKPSGIKYCSTT